MMSFQHKKKFGQNFLTFVPQEFFLPDDLFKSFKNITIIEIGTGLGAVTKEIAQHYAIALPHAKIDYHCIDIDNEALTLLRDEVKKLVTPNIRYVYHNKNVLECNIQQMSEGVEVVWIIGSLPYNISKKIVNWLFEGLVDNAFKAVLPVKFIMQKEVAEHYAGAGESRDFLYQVMQSYATNAKIIKILMPGSFVPAPDVTSALIEFIPVRTTREEYGKKEELLRFIRQCYSFRRKKIRQFVTKHLSKKQTDILLEKNDFLVPLLEKRPDELTLKEYAQIYSTLIRTTD